MKLNVLKLIFFVVVIFQLNNVFAWDGMPMPKLHVEGRYLKDSDGHIVNLHGFAQTYSPWFNEQDSQWSDYNVDGCLNYNKGIIDEILNVGWKMNFIRLHMDPYWSSTPGCEGRYEGEECFNETRFRKYLDEVFVPMAEYAVSKGMYVVMRPPGVSPEHIEIDGVYHKYLIKVWSIVSKHPKLMNNANIMFELANEPIDILGPDGTYGAGTQGHFDNLKTYFQTIVDTIRNSADNIVWIPGLGYQSLYAGYATNPIESQNIGYAVHVYPGWFNSGQGYEPFQRGWENQVQPVADFAPIIVTEMDWAPERHGKSWGKDITGTAGGDGFGANFKKITDDCGNVSWLLFTDPNLLADFGNPNADADVVDFLTDPEACPTPVYKWYQDYANEYGFDGVTDDYLTMTDLKIIGDTEISVLNKSSVGLKINAVFADGHVENVSSIAQITVDNPDVVNVVRGRIFTLKDGQATLNVSYTDKKGTTKKLTLKVTSTTFPLTNELFNPTIWENGTFDETTKTLKTGQWGFGGWQYDGIDLSEYKYIVAKLGSENNAEVAFNVYDGNSYWGSPASYKFGNNRQVVVVLNQAIKNDGTMLNPEHIYIAGFWSNGSNPFVIDTVFLSNSSEFDPPLVFAKDLSGNEIEMLNDFIYVKGNGPSACQSFTVSGDILTDNIVVKAPSRFEISLDSSQTFTSTLTIEQNNNQVLETTVFVRMKSELKRNEYNGEVSISSTGAFSKMIMLTGNVVWPTGVNNLINPATSVLSEQYYTLTGQKINNVDNMNGIFIVKSILSDGRIVTSKVFKHK
ncbi:MAG: cellulase family glycosylhydrolase [Prolixibacteraceae bacterium]|jgi:endoglucanase|nr:cellulase family glycosylhydrolase [Prolixibacteraceae bacterium]